MKFKTQILFWCYKKMILAVCLLAFVWLVMVVNAEEKQDAKEQKVQVRSTQASETKRSTKAVKTIFFPELTEHELKIQKALNTETECDFSETPLSEVMKRLAKQHNIQILVMALDLGEEGLTVDEPISFKIKGVSLKNALNLMLEPNKLTYVVAQDVLKITTDVKAGDELEYKLRLYPVGDFSETPQMKYGNYPQGYAELIDVIHTSILEYDDTITPVHFNKSLMIECSYHNHVAVVELLTQLRRARVRD